MNPNPQAEQPVNAPQTEQPVNAPQTEQPVNAPQTEQPVSVPRTEQPVNPYAHWKRDNQNAFMDYNFITVAEAGPNRAVTALTIRPETRNPYGVAHGGALYTMADNATGIAAHTDGRSYVTQSSNLYFLGNQADGTIRAEANVIQRGRTTCLVGVEITGNDGKRLAYGTFVYFCVDQTARPFPVDTVSG